MIMNDQYQAKFRRTPQRLAVLEFLRGTRTHPSADEIFEALRTRFPSISLSTVYNVLRALESEGLAYELAVDAERSRFDSTEAPHHHLVCLGCRKIVDVFRDFSVALAPCEASGFEVVRSQVAFFGSCPACRAERGPAGDNAYQRSVMDRRVMKRRSSR